MNDDDRVDHVQRVLIATSNPAFEAGSRQLLKNSRYVNAVGAINDIADIWNQIIHTEVDIVLVDTTMHHAATSLIHERGKLYEKYVSIVALFIDEPDIQTLVDLIHSGIDGIITADDHIPNSLHGIGTNPSATGWLSPTFGARLLRRQTYNTASDPTTKPTHTPLTAQESRVLHILAEGYTYRQTARKIDRAERTIKYHVANLLEKFQAHNRTHLISLAIKAGVLESSSDFGGGPG